MNYYKYIKGQRFDRDLLSLADQLIKNHVQITLEEAQSLFAEVSDGGTITQTERDTLKYLLDTYSWTPEARNWIYEQSGVVGREEIMDEEIINILDTYGLQEMEIRASRELIEEMNERYPSEISFTEALDLAIYTILNDESDRNSPRAVIMDVLETYPEQFEDYEDFDQIIRPELIKRMNQGYLMLIPIWEEIPEDDRDFNYPDNREASEKYWIFYLGIVTDDHQFWTIVDRQGEESPYNYGFN